jgi:calcium/calmodulin-dependent protein kinase I|mmetsp:Transcript_49473/g.82962  ORF Transcript_49473/g.82962 Transcript_49473/m.82962 type:complete len:328 (-) Transcript_49473:677-1660(-)|eukprot:CAMPEP_0174301278 /NCGR_PEP_ID=MMETSP0809-20121228/58959_1 /TAXON_ID=73025 ORGANISM="Eutreptiella gymnastica-like, Strain CCMP1594" /NCGR_SAMPLE_ID=MMETSP0809 /ASSEMBLY_ACC=CAM_ASM_000658 /LENGTH=327 /DNA_ID=CAMNT_0015407009 /DNA_START=26 /DNA_END=1009 /DNA_ORIENTATION=-
MKGFLKKIKDKTDSKKSKKTIFDVSSSFAEKYDVKEVLGKGSFSVVRLGVSTTDPPEHVAVKIIDKNNIDVKVQNLKTEVSILMDLSHPNIVNLTDVYEDSTYVYMVMDLMMGGELFDRICNDYPMGYSEKTSSIIMKKVLSAIEYLHGKGVIHRDLKPENLLYARPDDDTDIRITDFGLAKIYRGDIVVKTACGSPNYVAPEVLLSHQEGYSFAVDMWSLGVILYVLLCGFCPFFDENTATLFNLITSGSYSFPSPYWDHISNSAKDLITHLLEVDPTKRLSATECLQHSWIENNAMEKNIPNITQHWVAFKAKRGLAKEPEGDEE